MPVLKRKTLPIVHLVEPDS